MKSREENCFQILGIILYRLVILSTLTVGGQHGYSYFHPDDTSIQPKKVLKLYKYFTCITQTLCYMYYITSILLLLLKCKRLHGYFYLTAFAYDTTMMTVYWSAYFYDQRIITSIEELKNMPLWYNHICHTIGLPALLLDAYLYNPQSVSIKKSMMIVFSLGAAYNFYIEMEFYDGVLARIQKY
ncbi:unnamed protein product [Heterobilharzia americana]|nr:unnamed protein product [Heterobilharzia americana]